MDRRAGEERVRGWYSTVQKVLAGMKKCSAFEVSGLHRKILDYYNIEYLFLFIYKIQTEWAKEKSKSHQCLTYLKVGNKAKQLNYA